MKQVNGVAGRRIAIFVAWWYGLQVDAGNRCEVVKGGCAAGGNRPCGVAHLWCGLQVEAGERRGGVREGARPVGTDDTGGVRLLNKLVQSDLSVCSDHCDSGNVAGMSRGCSDRTRLT
jgi:hypothetical protein